MGKSVKERKQFDALVSRILFLELGIAFLAVSFLIFFNNPTNETMTIFFGGGFSIIGLFCTYCCFMPDDKKVINWANNTGNHEVMFLFIGAAYGLAALVRGSK